MSVYLANTEVESILTDMVMWSLIQLLRDKWVVQGIQEKNRDFNLHKHEQNKKVNFSIKQGAGISNEHVFCPLMFLGLQNLFNNLKKLRQKLTQIVRTRSDSMHVCQRNFLLTLISC